MKNNTWWRLLVMLVACVAVIGIGMIGASAEMAVEEEKYTAVYANGAAVIYEEADLNSQEIKTVEDGTVLMVREFDATWLQVREGGYVQKLSTRLEPEAPATDEPTDEEPVDEEPADEEPADEEPVDEEPVDEEPADEEPVDEEPADEEPADEEPTEEEPVAEEPAEEEPADDSSEEMEIEDYPTPLGFGTSPEAVETEADDAAEEPAAEEPVAEEPVAEEPVVEEPVAEERPAVERSVITHSSLEGLTQVYEKSFVVLTAELIGFEDTTYTVQWQFSPDGGETFIDIPGANDLTYIYQINEENFRYIWSVKVVLVEE